MLQIMSRFSLSPDFSLRTIMEPLWFKVILVSSVQRIIFHNCSASLAKSNLAFFFSSVISGLHLVVSPLYFHSIVFPFMKALLIAGCDNDAPTSPIVFLTWLDVVELFFLTVDIILLSSTLAVFCGLPCLLVLLSWPVHSLFFKNCFLKKMFWRLLI